MRHIEVDAPFRLRHQGRLSMLLVTKPQLVRCLGHITRDDTAQHAARRNVSAAVRLEAETRRMLALVLAQKLLENKVSRIIGGKAGAP
jgi:hypothetical protein